ncbi:hypothetical protein C8R44DRAFT_869747 [Mycena epipterygia]|nr:hypothetical protein C8R44DRAFT_869747 [Mycena epipterygia]
MALPRRTLHDKTSYSILPTPPSPTRITSPGSPSPSLSPSNSNSVGSATEPTTPPVRPPRGRGRNLYPESIGRVPLHRRGTSKTYERLEDLLREAGYKETRIFTPETERTAPQAQDEIKSPTIAAFVGFLSNLVPSRSASVKRDEESDAHPPVYSPPISPSVNRTPRPSGSHATRISSTKQLPRINSNVPAIIDRVGSPSQPPSARRGSRTGNPASALSPRRGSHAGDPASALSPRRSTADMQQQRHRAADSVISPLATSSQQLPPLHHPVPDRPVNRYYQHHPSSSRGSGVSSPPPPVHHPTPTRASSYLRHMTSYDRPKTTPPTQTYARVTDDAEEESLLSPTLPPRMPSGWMDNVKRAREYFAVPPLPPISGSPAPVVASKLGRSVSAKTRGRLSDRTNANANNTLAPPLLTTRLTTTRAQRSESQVSVGRVVCRSRGSSPVRREKGKGREADLDLRGQFEIPEPDDLARSRFLGGWGTSAAASAQLLSPPRRRETSEFDSGESDVSSEGEEEITLARILVPSRHERPTPMERSRSVRSLRRCLELDSQGQEVPPVPPLPQPNTGSARWSLSLSWGRARSEAERRDMDDPEVFVRVPTNGKGSQRQRPALPAWGD